MEPLELNGDVLELLARVGGTLPSSQSEWMVDDPTRMIAACANDLDSEQLAGFKEAFEEPWTMLLVLHCEHPSLMEVAGWAYGRADTILLASPSGPPPPALAIFTRPPRS